MRSTSCYLLVLVQEQDIDDAVIAVFTNRPTKAELEDAAEFYQDELDRETYNNIMDGNDDNFAIIKTPLLLNKKIAKQ